MSDELGRGGVPIEINTINIGEQHWMRRRGKLGGQHKVPRVINDEHLFADLRGFVTAGT